jgi:hypothetical protein
MRDLWSRQDPKIPGPLGAIPPLWEHERGDLYSAEPAQVVDELLLIAVRADAFHRS